MRINIYNQFPHPNVGEAIVSFTPNGVGDTDNVDDSVMYTLYVVGRYEHDPNEIEDFITPFKDNLTRLSSSNVGNPCELLISSIDMTTEYTTNDVYDGQIVNLVYRVYTVTIQATEGDFSDVDNANEIYVNDEKVKPLTSGNWLDVIYPVGTYYHTSDTSFNPNTYWTGTTWVDATSAWTTPGKVWQRTA